MSPALLDALHLALGYRDPPLDGPGQRAVASDRRWCQVGGNRFAVMSAVHLVLMRDRDVLLLRRYNTGFEDGNYSVPAGHLDGDEPVSQAMARETLEETGIVVDPRDLSVVHVMHRAAAGSGGERIDFFLSADRWSGQPVIREPDKCDELAWHPLGNLPSNTIPYIAAALEAHRSAVAFSEYGWNSSVADLVDCEAVAMNL